MSKWSIERWLLVLTFALSSVAFVFGLGVNWAHITEQDAAISAFEKTYLRADVYASDQRRISESLDRLSDELKMWRQQQQQAPRTPQSPSGRMFDR
jgi:hypothetical protein